jgi:hypothetical protein
MGGACGMDGGEEKSVQRFDEEILIGRPLGRLGVNGKIKIDVEESGRRVDCLVEDRK